MTRFDKWVNENYPNIDDKTKEIARAAYEEGFESGTDCGQMSSYVLGTMI